MLLPLLVAAGCGDADEEDGRFVQLAAQAEAARELSFQQQVPIRAVTPEEYQAGVDASAAEAEATDLAELAATYGRLGFFPIDADLRSFLGDSRDWVAGEYSPKDKEIRLVGDVEDSVVVHELVHGLQDQHFDLQALDEREGTSDSFLARRAIVEGDAMLAEGRFVLRSEYDGDLNRVDWGRFLPALHENSEDLLNKSEIPLIFISYPSFVYSSGLEYCAHNLTGVSADSPYVKEPFPFDWTRENALFTGAMPPSTQQVLQFGLADDEVEVGLDDVPAELADRLERTSFDTLGEWYSYLLLRPIDPRAPADQIRRLASTWDGDRALFVRDKQTGALGTAWASAWEEDGDAVEIALKLWALYGASATDEAEPRLGTSADGERVWIERRGARVVALKNVDPELMPALAAAAFPTGAAPRSLLVRTRPSLAAWLADHVAPVTRGCARAPGQPTSPEGALARSTTAPARR